MFVRLIVRFVPIEDTKITTEYAEWYPSTSEAVIVPDSGVDVGVCVGVCSGVVVGVTVTSAGVAVAVAGSGVGVAVAGRGVAVAGGGELLKLLNSPQPVLTVLDGADSVPLQIRSTRCPEELARRGALLRSVLGKLTL